MGRPIDPASHAAPPYAMMDRLKTNQPFG
jgi:hypothetical protein